jgi:hypothetical protein
LRIRHDLVFVSCVLFTIASLYLIPIAWWYAQAGYGDMRGLNPDIREIARSQSDVGRLWLELIIVGLIVTWTGYVNKVRWTWFVMFILVPGLTFRTGIFPFFVHPRWVVEAVSELILEALGKKPATIFPLDLAWRSFIEPILIFLLMVIALLLPVKSFFSRRTGPAI